MDFLDIARMRQSCRRFDAEKTVEQDKLDCLLEALRVAPSACNGQPYHVTVCREQAAKRVAKATQSMHMNAFASDAPIMLVLSEKPYVKTAALGAKIKGNDYRSMDIGIAAAYITAEAATQGLATCMLGWFDEVAVRDICGVDGTVRLVIAVGYADGEDRLRPKKRKDLAQLTSTVTQ